MYNNSPNVSVRANLVKKGSGLLYMFVRVGEPKGLTKKVLTRKVLMRKVLNLENTAWNDPDSPPQA